MFRQTNNKLDVAVPILCRRCECEIAILTLQKLFQYNSHSIPLHNFEATFEQGCNFEAKVPTLPRHYEYDFAILMLQKYCQYNIHSTPSVKLTSQR